MDPLNTENIQLLITHLERVAARPLLSDWHFDMQVFHQTNEHGVVSACSLAFATGTSIAGDGTAARGIIGVFPSALDWGSRDARIR